MMDDKTFQLMLKELELSRAERLALLDDRQKTFNILTASWLVLMTGFVVFLNKWSSDPLYFWYGSFCTSLSGFMVNTITLLRLINNGGELDIARLRKTNIIHYLIKFDVMPDYYDLLNVEYGEDLYEHANLHYSSFTKTFCYGINLFILGSSVVNLFCITSFVMILMQANKFKVYTFSILPISFILSAAWYLYMRSNFKTQLSKHLKNVDILAKEIQKEIFLK